MQLLSGESKVRVSMHNGPGRHAFRELLVGRSLESDAPNLAIRLLANIWRALLAEGEGSRMSNLERDGSTLCMSELLHAAFPPTEYLCNVSPESDQGDGDYHEENEWRESGNVFRLGEKEYTGMNNKELFERLELGENFDIEDLILVTTLLNPQQQDPNATNNLLNAVILAKVLGRPGGRRFETFLLLNQLLTASSQAAAGGTGQPAMPNNLLNTLLVFSLLRGEGGEGFLGPSRRGWRGKKEDFDEGQERQQAPH